MRVLYLHQFFATRASSGAIRSYEFARRMAADGVDVTMVTSSAKLPEDFCTGALTEKDLDGIHVRAVHVPYSNYMSYARRILAFLQFMIGASLLAMRGPRPDVVFATSTPLTIAVPGWIASRWHRVPLVFEVRDLWPEAAIQMGALSRESVLGRVAKRLERFAYRKSSHVVALSPGMLDGVLAEGMPAQRVHLITNSSDLDLFSPGPKDGDMVARLGLEGKFVVAYAGAIGPSNAVEKEIPQAARELKRRGRDDIRFLVAGDGMSLPAVRELVDEWGLDNVIITGSVSKLEVPPITRTADMLMTLFADKPILATNSPNKFFDGLAAGRPMLVNSAGWTKDLVEQHGAGIYVPAENAAAMADAIERVADDAELRARMGVNARRLAEEQFSRDVLADKLVKVLQAAARERSRG